jgi:hypothetical protein
VYVASTEDGKVCLAQRDTKQWLGGDLSTYAMPVYEIEALIVKFQGMVESMTESILHPAPDDTSKMVEEQRQDMEKLNKQKNHWASVLVNYRDHTSSLEPL